MNQKSKLEQKKSNLRGLYSIVAVTLFIGIVMCLGLLAFVFGVLDITPENQEVAHALIASTVGAELLVISVFLLFGKLFGVYINELTKTNTDFWADTASETLDKVVKAVDAQLKKQMSDSARAKFDGEVAQITAVMAGTIPDKLVELLTKVANYERKDGLPHVEHGQMSALTTFFYTTKNKLDVIAATEQLAMQDIDDELSDIIDDWGKLKKEWNM